MSTRDDLSGRRPSLRYPKLTRREGEIFDMVVLDMSNKDCADRLRISVRTVEVFRRRLMAKLKVETMAQLMWMGIADMRPPQDWKP